MTSAAVVDQYSRSTLPPGCWMTTAAASAAWQLPISPARPPLPSSPSPSSAGLSYAAVVLRVLGSEEAEAEAVEEEVMQLPFLRWWC
ncbi:hypothetical protein ABZP36_035619 [Zizania latifolia]